MRVRFPVLIGLFLLCCSCGEGKDPARRQVQPLQTDRSADAVIASPEQRELRIDTLDPKPVDEQGAGIMLRFKGREAYAFFDDFSGTAVMMLDGKRRVLRQTDTEAELEAQPDSLLMHHYRGDGYDATLRLRQSKAYDEGGAYEGAIELRRGAATAHIPVEGEIGS